MTDASLNREMASDDEISLLADAAIEPGTHHLADDISVRERASIEPLAEGTGKTAITEPKWHDREVSMFAVGATLLRSRWRLVRWMLIGAVLAVLPALFKPPAYRASASFVSQGADVSSRQGLAALAGQLGGIAPALNQSQSPEFYVMLLQSRELLQPIARDTFVVQEERGRRVSFFDLFEIHGTSQKSREEQGVALLKHITSASSDRTTGVVSISSLTRWPSVSLATTGAMVDGLNAFNQRTRQSQAAAERRFVEGRLAMATQDLRLAEDRLQGFLAANKQYENSPQLTFQRDRLQRDVSLKQQVFNSLTAAYEDVRIREVRDTPVITVVESPSVPATPEPRGRLKRALFGLLLGGVFGTLLVLLSEMLRRGRATEDPEANEFFQILRQIKRNLFGWAPRLRERVAR